MRGARGRTVGREALMGCGSCRVPLSVVVGLFVAVTVLRWFVDGSGQAAALLYVVPITLSALCYGRRAGAGAAALGAAAFAVLAIVRGRGDLDLTGWVGPVIAMGVVGGLVGHLAERAARPEPAATGQLDRHRHLEALCAAQQAALEVSDSIVQDVAAARWMLEVGRTDEARDVLGGTVAEGISRLSQALSRPPAADG